jgi:probable rRNA maturation factor
LIILEKKIAGLSEAGLARFVLRARRSVELRGSVNLLVTTSQRMRLLNHRFRGKNQPTDVLSFPAEMGTGKSRAVEERIAGEIAISAEIATQNALRLGHSAAAEVKVLALHGILHLAGFDHECDDGEMAREEARLRGLLKLPAALIERGAKAPRPRKPDLRRAARTT